LVSLLLQSVALAAISRRDVSILLPHTSASKGAQPPQRAAKQAADSSEMDLIRAHVRRAAFCSQNTRSLHPPGLVRSETFAACEDF